MDLEINSDCVQKVPIQEHLKEFPVIENSAQVNYNSFFEKYLLRNQACLIKNVAADWQASKTWIIGGSFVNFEYLKERYGNCTILAYDCNATYFNTHKTEILPVNEYLRYWQKHNDKGKSFEAERLLYLKDWHLKNEFPADDFYKVPLYFASDWLNEFLVDTNKDDYRFVYMGPKGTWTPLHVDVFKSYSWSVNVMGKKEWILLPPGEEDKLKDEFDNLPHEIASTEGLEHFRVIQHAGDAIFVPSSWYHQVTNLEDTISINHNWINGCNLQCVYENLQQHFEDVHREIADCSDDDDFQDQCQLVLKASLGMNFHDFLAFLMHIAEKRMESIGPGPNLSKFDLLRIQNVLDLMQHDDHIQSINLMSKIQPLHEEIDAFLNS